MSVRVVARIRPLLKAEVEKDQILSIHNASNGKPQVIKIPNPKLQHEGYSFNFAAAYGQDTTQQDLFDVEGMVTDVCDHLTTDAQLNSRAYYQTPIPRFRRDLIRLWRHRKRKDTHDARRQINGRPRYDPSNAQQYL